MLFAAARNFGGTERTMTARECALRALYDIEKNGAYTNTAIKNALAAELSPSDRGFVTEIIYGVTANRTAIDYIISRYSKLRLKKLSVWVLCILRMGVFQIYYMDKVPYSAACNESVKLAKKYSHGAGAGFVNGVLRSFSREADGFEFPKLPDKTEYLSLVYSYPQWIVRRIAEEYGEERCEELLRESGRAHRTALRVNRLKTKPAELIRVLAQEGIHAGEYAPIENCLLVSEGSGITGSKAYRDGLFSVQNISSQLAVQALDPQSGDLVIDMCAAPGGKSCAAAERMNNCGKILAFDMFEHKVKLIDAAAKRLGIDIINAAAADSCVPDTALEKSADRVIADVPCSGIGVIHKKPDIKWHRHEEDIAALAEIQTAILENAARYVKCGGVLVYSTCTVFGEENGAVTGKFLNEHDEFERLDEKQLLTSALGESGFYICKMQRKK